MNRLKELRLAHGYKSQQALADAIFVNQTAVSQWERGVTMPSNQMLLRLSKLFGKSIDYILGNTEADEKVQPPTDDSKGLDRNVIKIAGRDGSNYEYAVSDGQRELVRQMLDNFKPVEEERT